MSMDPGNPASLEAARFGSTNEESGGGQSDRKRRKTIPSPMDTHFPFLQEQPVQTMAPQGDDRTSTGGTMMMMMGPPPPLGNPSVGVGWGTAQQQSQNLGNLQQLRSLQDHGASLSGRVGANNLVSDNVLASNERGGAARPSPSDLLGEDRGGLMNGRQDAQQQQMMAFQAQQLLQQAVFMTGAQGFNFQSGLFPQSNPGSHIMNMPPFSNFVSPANAAINPDSFTPGDASHRDDRMPLYLGAGRGANTEFEPAVFPEDDAKSHNDNDTVLTGRRPILLAMECDTDSISEYQCLVRQQVEIFEAGHKDIETNAKGRNKPIVLGQVGIRCSHCSNIPTKERKRGAMYFPAKLNGLYQAAQSLASAHLCAHCEHVPAEIREQLIVLKEKKSSAGGGKDYWGDAVRILGVYEDADGLRFKKEKK